MKKILITRKLIKDSEDKASKTFEPIFNSNDELYSQSKVIEMSKGCDGMLTSLTDKMDKETINKLPDTIKIISNFAVGFGNIDLDAAKKRNLLAGLHNGTAEYAQKMIEKGFNLVTVGSDSRYIASGAKSDLEKLKGIKTSKSKGY